MDNLTYNDKDLARDWQQMIENKFNHSNIEKDNIMDAITQESKSNIGELKKRLKYKIYWSLFFIIIFSGAFIASLSYNSELAMLVGFIVLAYVLGFISMFIKYKSIKESSIEGMSLLASLKTNLRAIKSVLNYERIWGVAVFAPIIIVTILGGKVIKGISIAESLNDPKTLLLAVVSITIIVPLMLWLASKMNNFAYGELLKKMEENIVKMETLS